MLKVQHVGQTFEAKGNTLFVGDTYFVLTGDVLALVPRQGDLFVTTDRAEYVIVGVEPRDMYIQMLREAA